MRHHNPFHQNNQHHYRRENWPASGYQHYWGGSWDSYGYGQQPFWNSPHGYATGNQRGRPFHHGQGNAFSHGPRYPHQFEQYGGINWVQHNQRGCEESQGSWRTSRDLNYQGSGHRENWNYRNRGQGAGQRTQRQQRQSQQAQKHGKPQVTKKFLDFSFLTQPDVVHLMVEFKVMVILRGLPGSGKSTVAQAILEKYQEHAVICSADFYRYNKRGEYVWSEHSLQETHEKCQRRAQKFCAQSKPLVVIDNTNVTFPEMQPYFQIAKKNGYVAVVIEPRTPWKLNARELVKKNKHNVSFTKLTRKIEQFEDIVPLYFGWFLPQTYSLQLRKRTKHVLESCLEIQDFKQCMTKLSGQNTSTHTVEHLLSLYSMITDCNENELHVTACFSPRGKYLGPSQYIKSSQVLDNLGHISMLTIIGWVITNTTLSARVVLTKKQNKLWKNDDRQNRQKMANSSTAGHRTTRWRGQKPPQQAEAQMFGKSRRGSSRGNSALMDHTSSLFETLHVNEEDVAPPSRSMKEPDSEASDCKTEMVQDSSVKHLRPDYGISATTHITLGKTTDTSPVQAKYDVQTIIDHELRHHVYQDYTLHDGTGILKKYNDYTWAVYLVKAIEVPGIFSGSYESTS